MKKIHAEYTMDIDATPAAAYAIFADFNGAHQAILPKSYFQALSVEQGGTGAGTVFRTEVLVMGQTAHYHMVVSEPEPGRVIVEADEQAGVTTTTTFEPLTGGARSCVTIATDFTASPGVKGWVERMLQPPITRRIYKQELQNLAGYLNSKRSG